MSFELEPRMGGEQARELAESIVEHVGILRLMLEDDLWGLMSQWRGMPGFRHFPRAETRCLVRQLLDGMEALARQALEEGFEKQQVIVRLGDCEMTCDLFDVVLMLSPQLAQARHVDTLLESFGVSAPRRRRQGGGPQANG